MKCNYCGKETSDDSVFCEYCGKQLSKNKFNLQSKRQLIIVCVAVVLGIAIGLVIAFATKDSDTIGLLQANNAVESERHIIASQNKMDHAWFQQQQILFGSKVDETFNKTSLLKKETEDIVNKIEEIKKDLIIEVDKTYEDNNGPKTAATVKSPNERAKTSRFLKKNSNVSTLKSDICNYKANILKLAKEEDRKRLEEAIGLDEQYNFSNISLSGAILLLNAIEIEILNAESTMLSYLKASISVDPL